MTRPTARPARPWIVLAALLIAVAGCGDDNPADPGGGNGGSGAEGSELAGNWSVTRFDADGVDGIAAGMTADITFDVTASAAPMFRGAAGTYTVDFTNDQLGLCDGATDCVRTGPFDVQGTTIRFNPDSQDELSWTYWVDGTSMGMSTVTDGVTIQVEAQRSATL